MIRRITLSHYEEAHAINDLRNTLASHSGRVVEAAEALGVPRRTLDDHITDWGLRPWLERVRGVRRAGKRVVRVERR